MKNFSIKAAIICLTLCYPSVARAQSNHSIKATQPAIITITPDEGSGLTQAARTIEVWSGRATAIDFSLVNEQIIQVFLADPSRFTYATDTPLDKGKATTLFLRQILPLKFPNLTTARETNLFIKTKTTDGNVRLYTFNIRPGTATPVYHGLSVANVTSSPNGKEPVLQVGFSRQATLDDIERGLQIAIARGYSTTSDPIVYKVRDFLARARNTNYQSLVELAQTVKIPLPVLTQLGSLGIGNVQ
ncbi:hypothetical protein [Floridanema aerugineum]|uniref:Uncharacterized protein n=1 Tax=Floridaenema aerugineum BLCC-F46 TaxID=3153654 RepID=A0ABV4X971_9CYAN